MLQDLIFFGTGTYGCEVKKGEISNIQNFFTIDSSSLFVRESEIRPTNIISILRSFSSL